ncbi:hypothetical protein [Micromonospora echinofusca]|uniref:Uncharacterized protein n=1 Tax=Micromonospora echinofusca TaxID=47858 RepID=A0ABS3VVY5_MICEH|nr:hypothetical protein [Micromonospora echinofusca]MBO4208697.1 hypothetical protein [Micromonospora echinofusca]
MTEAPANLLAVRSLLLDHLDNLAPASVGIVGDAHHVGGYHCGSDRVTTNDYSVVESPRDSSGLTRYASAIDIGTFSVTVAGRSHNLRTFSTWCVAQCTAGTADTQDIREVIYSPDGVVVRRWDRLARRTTGDSSHLTHTHVSYFRDATKAGRDETPLYRRYLTEIGLLPKEDDMPTVSEIWGAQFGSGDSRRTAGQLLAEARNAAVSAEQKIDLLTQQVAQLLVRDFTDEPAIVAGVLATLTPTAIASAIPPTLAQQVADELARRLVS